MRIPAVVPKAQEDLARLLSFDLSLQTPRLGPGPLGDQVGPNRSAAMDKASRSSARPASILRSASLASASDVVQSHSMRPRAP